MKDDLRHHDLHDLGHASLIADVGEDEIVTREQALAIDAQLHGVDGRLVAIQNADEGWAIAVYLAGKLGADRAPGPGDEDALALKQFGNGGFVSLDRSSAK